MSSYGTFRSDFPIRIPMAISFLTLLAACSSTAVTKTDAKLGISETASLTGRWRGASEGLTVDMTVVQTTGGVVTGTGNYSVTKNSSIGCGGESLPPSGSVILGGQLAGSTFSGRMTFADWTPPYLGTFSSPDSLNGHFMSVDRGGCPLVLVRQHQE